MVRSQAPEEEGGGSSGETEAAIRESKRREKLWRGDLKRERELGEI